MPGRERQRQRLPPPRGGHLPPCALQDAGDLHGIASFGKALEFRFQEDKACAVLEGLRFAVALDSAFPDQRPNALDGRGVYAAGRENIADRLRLSPRRIATPPEVSLPARGKVTTRIAPPLEMLRPDGYPEVVGWRFGKQR